MEIICPQCQFSREVDETKIPASSKVATCPKCQTKFQFRDIPEAEEPAPQPEPEAPTSNEPRQASLFPEKPQSEDVRKFVPTTRPERDEPVSVEPVEPLAPTDEPETSLPHIETSGDKASEALWDKLNGMAPPQPKPETEEFETPHAATEPTPPPAQQAPVPGWTGEFNEDFPDPMEDEKPADDRDEGPMPLVPPPFEQLDRYGFFHGIYMTLKLILTSPRLFFGVMPVGGGLAKPLTFTILLTMLQSFAQYLWTLAGLAQPISPPDQAMSEFSSATIALFMLLLMPAFIAAAQFTITGVYHLLLILMKADNQGFEGTFRALAYANAPIILGIIPMVNPMFEIGVMAVIAFWGLFLTIVGLRSIHDIPYSKAVPVALVPLLLGMIVALMAQGQMPAI